MIRKVTLLMMALVTMMAWQSIAGNNPEVREIDLDVDSDYNGTITDADDSIETSKGGIVYVGYWTNITIKQILTTTQPGDQNTVRLSWITNNIELAETSGGAAIAPEGFMDTAQTTAYKDFPGLNTTKTLWVHGISTSHTARAEAIRLELQHYDEAYDPNSHDEIAITVLLNVDLDGDNEEDGDVDDEDDEVEDDPNYPVIVAINEDKRELTVRKIGVSSGGTLKIKKSGAGMITLKKPNGTTILGASDSMSIDILADAASADVVLDIDGTAVGKADLELEFASGSYSRVDKLKVRVVKSDIVQRSGSTHIAHLISESLTHSGIDWEDKVTDLYDPGIESISLSSFELLADGGPEKKRLRLKKGLYMARRVWARIYDNMENSAYANPSGLKPYNLFTTSTNYLTSNCNEFVKEQFRKAISDVYGGLTKQVQQSNFKTTYYLGNSVSTLCDGKHIMTLGGESPTAAVLANAMVQYLEYRSKKVGATTLFQNAFEGDIPIFWFNPYNGGKYNAGYASCDVCGTFPPLPWYLYPVVKLYDEAHISTITPSRLSGSAYFETITY